MGMGRAVLRLTLVSSGPSGSHLLSWVWGPPFFWTGPPSQNPRHWNILGLYDLCWWVMPEP